MNTRKTATAAKLKKIEHALKTTNIPTKDLLARVGIKSVNTIKNHYGLCREDMQRKYKRTKK